MNYFDNLFYQNMNFGLHEGEIQKIIIFGYILFNALLPLIRTTDNSI